MVEKGFETAPKESLVWNKGTEAISSMQVVHCLSIVKTVV